MEKSHMLVIDWFFKYTVLLYYCIIDIEWCFTSVMVWCSIGCI